MICSVLLWTERAGAQDTLQLDFSRPVDRLDLRHQLSVFTGEATPATAAALPFGKDTSIFHPRKNSSTGRTIAGCG
ncbi:hypothetical protein [Chitinophaga caseinilytica]|uniref:Uncharacterized protein n=1 Tax=Chitinophaga caseinilytica TaxID=2267521 RepID=A0ABZ2Z904_9BACT